MRCDVEVCRSREGKEGGCCCRHSLTYNEAHLVSDRRVRRGLLERRGGFGASIVADAVMRELCEPHPQESSGNNFFQHLASSGGRTELQLSQRNKLGCAFSSLCVSGRRSWLLASPELLI
jgi:hypothetical protein